VQLQKSLFLLGTNFAKVVGSDFYDFLPYNYGPFNASIYADAERLERDGLVAIKRDSLQRWREYVATNDGLTRARELAAKTEPGASDYLRRVVLWAKSLTFQQLVGTIYKNFPSYRVNSVFSE
jgi:hypothetical protein